MNIGDLEELNASIGYVINVRNLQKMANIERLPEAVYSRMVNGAEGATFIDDFLPVSMGFGVLAEYLDSIVDMMDEQDYHEAETTFNDANVAELARDSLQKLADDFFKFYDGRTNLLFEVYDLRDEFGVDSVEGYVPDEAFEVIDEIAEILQNYES